MLHLSCKDTILSLASVLILTFLLFISIKTTAADQDDIPLKALIQAKLALKQQDYQAMWIELDALTAWLDKNAPRSGLSWPQAKEMIKQWVENNWHENVLEVTALSQGGMAETTQRHQGSFYGFTWDTGEKTVTKDFVFEAHVKATNRKGKVLQHRIRFHFDKSASGWVIKRAGVM
jgi:hypothetical protein